MDRLPVREEGVLGELGFRIGEMLPNGVRLERLIDGGGRVAVFEGRRTHDGIPVAVKVPNTLIPDAERQALFAAIRDSSAFRGSHVLRVLDVGALPSGALYWVTELAGASFRTLADRRELVVRDVVKAMIQVAAALEEAHALGLPHGDIRLEKILVGSKEGGRPTIKLADVGHAAVLANALGAAVRATVPPERLGGLLDQRSDVYSIGASAYEILALRPLFFAATDEELRRKIAAEEPNPLGLVAPSTPAPIMNILHRAVAKDPALRFESCRALEIALRSAIGARDGSPAAMSDAVSLPGQATKGRAPLWLLAVGIFVGVLVAALGMWIFGR